MDEFKPSQPPREPLIGFGARLNLARRHRGLRMADLADLSKISKVTISALENNRRVPAIKTICLLAIALNVETVWLAFGEGESGLPEGEPLYNPPEPHNKKRVSPEERAERKQLNQVAHRIAQTNGTSFYAEREALREQREREREERESEERYSTATPDFLAKVLAEGAEGS